MVIQKTERGFQLIQFEDRYGSECSLQQSSVIWDNPHGPGSSGIWLGVDKDFSPTASGHRMHLDRPQAAKLEGKMQRWLMCNATRRQS